MKLACNIYQVNVCCWMHAFDVRMQRPSCVWQNGTHKNLHARICKRCTFIHTANRDVRFNVQHCAPYKLSLFETKVSLMGFVYSGGNTHANGSTDMEGTNKKHHFTHKTSVWSQTTCFACQRFRSIWFSQSAIGPNKRLIHGDVYATHANQVRVENSWISVEIRTKVLVFHHSPHHHRASSRRNSNEAISQSIPCNTIVRRDYGRQRPIESTNNSHSTPRPIQSR